MSGIRPLLLIFVASIAALVPARAADGWMSDAELNAAFSGKGVEGEYPNGASFREAYGSDGRVQYEDEDRVGGGRWSVTSGTFCTIYDNDPSGGCFRVRKTGANCFEFFFVAREEEDAKEKRPETANWSARAWLEDRSSTCKKQIGV